MRGDWPNEYRHAVYWRGALYVHCQTDFVMRISLSSDKYHVIVKPPLETCTNCYLGKSAKGVYCASIIGRCRVQVWNLDESGCKMEWILKHDRDLRKWLLKHKLEHTRPSRYHGRAVRGPWTLQNINYHYNDHCSKDDDMVGALVEEETSVDENFTWSSDDECGDYGDYLDILGFHPCKEIIFLSEYITRGLAYDMNSSTVEVLGNIYPALYGQELGNEQLIMSSFTYTPCWLGQTADENN
ncbi:unnamed protein product [Urochloa decumbens]|uniref:Uncharacterized protein n=1 Tax=Urochloa decumbens TaxID=240449 RepID=A0ABC8YHP4_9POAL